MRRGLASAEALRDRDRFIVCEVRGDLQAVDLDEQLEALRDGELLDEGNPMMGLRLLEHPALSDVSKIGVFVSPLGRSELQEIAGREGSDHWTETGVVLGSARRAVENLAALLREDQPGAGVERWPASLLPEC